jgi:UDP-N-acetylmuramoyl-L-alanyl-D-glutamate--2,6-diaminopimelate ligase
MTKLKSLLKDLPEVVVKGSKDVTISGLTSHSKRVAPGDLYFAKKGRTAHGAEFIKDAVLSGAKAIVTDLYNPFFKTITQLIVDDVEAFEVLFSKKFYSDPSSKLFLVGITGTSGKTTTSFLIRHILSTKSHPCGLIGGVEIDTGKHHLVAELTTPDILSINKYLKEMTVNNASSCAMEVSSHALDQGRVRGLEFDLVIFTNLTQDHLDYHKTHEEYKQAKAKLFIPKAGPKETKSIINIDCPHAPSMMQGLPVLTYSLEDPSADYYIKAFSLASLKTEFILSHQGNDYRFEVPLIGKFNLYNTLAAIITGHQYGFSFLEIAKKLESFPGVPGRMQVIKAENFHVVIDNSHKEDALENVLKTLRSISLGKIITVFGCGGDRDQSKRPKMGKIASDYSDTVIVTSDNPRSEDPEAIIQDVLGGISKKASYKIIVNRKEAIAFALSIARAQDWVLIAGKGHEQTQIFQNKTIEFNDYEVAKAILIEKGLIHEDIQNLRKSAF